MLRTTPQERQALLVTALLLVAGAGVRIVSAPEPGVEWDTGVSDTLVVNGLAEVRQGAEAALERERIRSRPLGPGERIDPNRADELQLDRLPRVGPALAARIVAWREEHGPFASLQEIDEVDGVGPGLLEAISPHLDLPERSAGPERAVERPERVDVNRASVDELQALPGIGPALAERIDAHRKARGPFETVDALDAVPGIGPSLLKRLTPLVTVDR